MSKSTEVAERSNTAVGAAGAYNPFTAAGAGAGANVFVKFDGKTGNFTYGQNDDEIEHGTQLAADIMNAEWHWSFWWEGNVLDTRKTRIVESPLEYQNYPDDLPDDYTGDMSIKEIKEAQADRKTNFMDGWTVQGVVNLREIGGEGTEYTLKLNEGVALRAFRALLESFGRSFQLKGGKTPIVEVDADKYKSKIPGVGWRFAPRLKIVDWLSEEELSAMTGEDASDYDDSEEDARALPAPEEEAEKKPAARGRGRRGRGNF